MTPRCVFVQFTAKPSGSPISGLMVVDALHQAGYQVHAIFHQLGELAADYENRGCSIEHLPHAQWLAGGPWHRRLRRLLADIKASRLFVERFRHLRPQLVYVNNLTGLAAVLAARRLRIPCVWHLRELMDDVEGEMHAPWPGGKWLVRQLVRRLPSHIVAISRAVAENVVGCADGPRLTILPNAVGDEFFDCPLSRAEARARLGLPQQVPLVGVPGTLRPVKGHRFFLEAFASVAQAIPGSMAAITGDGEPRYRAELAELVQQRGLAGRVLFLGTVDDMPAFYRACDVICVPSRSEPFGRAAVEAMAAGTPVVATAVGGLAETIQPGVTGALVAYGDTSGLAQQLQFHLHNGGTSDDNGRRAEDMARSVYAAHTYQARIAEVLAHVAVQLLHRDRPAPVAL